MFQGHKRCKPGDANRQREILRASAERNKGSQ